MLDVLLGRVNPSGKLAETWPLKLEDCPSMANFPAKERTSEYRESLYIGYRYFDKAGKPVRYPFGYGLSYTSFVYTNLIATNDAVSFTLTNRGSRDGAEVAQVYVGCPDGKVFRPAKELKGFMKVFLKAGESRQVSIPLDDKAFRYFNVKTNRWEIENGEYEISVCASVQDVKLKQMVHVEGTKATMPYPSLPAYEQGNVLQVSDAEFAQLLGRQIPDSSWSGELQRNDAICQLYYAKCWAARMVYKALTHLKNKSEASGMPDLSILFIYNMPFRALAKMTGGLVSERMVDDIVFLVNGQFWQGLGRVIADFFRSQSESRKFSARLARLEKQFKEKNRSG